MIPQSVEAARTEEMNEAQPVSSHSRPRGEARAVLRENTLLATTSLNLLSLSYEA